jgi:hypothetical protein
MQNVKDFMEEFFRARIADEQRYQESRAPFREKYYAHECEADSRSRAIERLQSERVISIDRLGSVTMVITVQNNPFFSPGEQIRRQRYHLAPAAERWLIQSIEYECPFCSEVGDARCTSCKGKHWLSP